MIQLSDILSLDRTRAHVAREQIGSKKRVLEELSIALMTAHPELDEHAIFECLIGRERLGSTGLGHGVAIPHGRISGLTEPVGCLIVLENAIDFDALDNEPVDIFFGLFVPERSQNEHLELLSSLATLFGDANTRSALRNVKENETLFTLTLQHSQ